MGFVSAQVKTNVLKLWYTDAPTLGFYLPTLLQEFAGYNQQMSRLISAASGTIYVACSFTCLMLIDRVGRRK